MWELGGKQSSFTLKAAPGQVLDSAGEIFAEFPAGVSTYRAYRLPWHPES
jgi:hypothetical protein